MLKTGRRWLYIGHRWTGIALCLLFAIWFLSGVVMMYVPFPSFRAEERVATAPPIRWDDVKVAPDAALETLKLNGFPTDMRLGMSGGIPVYFMTTDDGRQAVSALTGSEITSVDTHQAKVIAEAFLHVPAVRIEAVDHDQWTVTKSYARIAPFWRIRMADPAKTDLYIARTMGEIVQNTTAHERFWNWLGSIPHWIYFSALRIHQETWRQVVLWPSGIGIIGAVAGVWIGLLRVRPSRRYASGSVTPYRGWMKWHHVMGLAGGLFVVTWMFSGWLSMSPFGGFRGADTEVIAANYAGHPGPRLPHLDMAALRRNARDVREIRFEHAGGRPLITVWGKSTVQLLDGRSGGPIALSKQTIEAFASKTVPNGRLISTGRLDRYDRYWYSSGDYLPQTRPLPILRLKFDDPNRTWLHIDPMTGRLLGLSDNGQRTDRWLFSALHTFDLPLLLQWPLFRDILMIVLSIAGLSISVTGIVIGWRRLRRPS